MRLAPELSQWEWKAFYWTKQDNRQGWKNPWRYFNLMSTDKLRSEACPGHQYAYSPYMEDGTYANCLNCQTLPAYGPHDNADRATHAATMANADPDPATCEEQE